MQIKERNRFIDFIKAFAIVLVVFDHCIQYGSGFVYLDKDLYFDNFIFKTICTFHMPLFMLISGYLFAFSNKKNNLKTTIYKKFKQLIIPLVSFAIVDFVIGLIQNGYVSLISSLIDLMTYFLLGPWFLWAIWWCSLVVCIVHNIFKDNKTIYILGFLLTFILPDAYGLEYYKFMYPFFLIGYYCNNVQIEEKLIKLNNNKLVLLGLGVIFIFLAVNYNREHYIYISGYSIFGKEVLQQVLIDLYRLIIGLIGSGFVINLMTVIYNCLNNKTKEIFQVIGKNSLYIYLVSGLIFAYILPSVTRNIIGLNYFVTTIETTIIIVICLIISVLAKKNRLINEIFFGGR